MEYGIGVQNRYALFIDGEDDAADPYALLTNAADTEPKAKATASAAGGKPGPKTPAGIPAKPTQKPTPGALSESKANVVANQKDAAGRQQNRDNRSRSGNQNQRPVRSDQENRTQRSPRVNNAFNQQPFESQGQDGEMKPTGGRDFRDGKDGRRNGFGPRGGGGRGGPGGRGGARFGATDARPKRDFNRHSGSDKTGIKATEKREGAGAHNWGKSVDDFTAPPEDELANGEQPSEPAAEGAEADAAAGEEKTGADGEEPKNDEPLMKTLDEYKREREEKRMHTQFNTRKANEGEDKTKWKKTFVLKKKEKTDEEEVEYEEIEVEEDPNKRRNRKVLDIEINFRPSEDGRDVVRRGRGGPGGRGRGGPRGGGGDRERGDDRRSAGGPPSGEARTPREPRQGGNERGRPSGGRGGRGQGQGGRFQSAPKFDDLNDFPSL